MRWGRIVIECVCGAGFGRGARDSRGEGGTEEVSCGESEYGCVAP